MSWKRLEKIKWREKVTNEQILERIGEKRTLLNNILRRKANWIGHILRRNCLLHDAVEGQITEMKGVGRRRTQFLDYLGNRRGYWELKESMDLLISSILNNIIISNLLNLIQNTRNNRLKFNVFDY